MDDRKKLELCILKELKDGNTDFSELFKQGVSKDDFWETIEKLKEKNYVTGGAAVRSGRGNHVRIIFTEDLRIRLDGEDFLHQNSPFMKLYRGIREFKSWFALL